MKCSRGCCHLKTWKNANRPWRCHARTRKRAGVILVCERNVLLVQTYGEYWGFPKGSIEADEKAEDAASRELYEETGIYIRPETIKTHGFEMHVSGGVLFILRLDSQPQPDPAAVRSVTDNDASGVGWANMACVARNRNLRCNKHLRKFVEFASTFGIDRWLSDFTTGTVVSAEDRVK